MAAFSDLNVFAGKDEFHTFHTLQMAIKLGYQVVAVNNFVEEIKGKSKKGPQINIKLPKEILLDEHRVSELKRTCGRGIRQLSRFTTVVDDPAQTHKLQSCAEIQAYDLLAVQPTSEKTFHMACGTLEIDIICIDFTEKLPFHIKRPSVSLAIERGIHFEIIYSPAILHSSNLKNIISNALSLMTICKGKNVIISSGCRKPIELRGPYDVANLALLFGMSQAQAKCALTKNCRAVLYHAESRKADKSTISVIKASSTLVSKHHALEDGDTDGPETKKRKTDIP